MLVVLVVLVFMSYGNVSFPGVGLSKGISYDSYGTVAESARYYPTPGDFAPDVEERQIIKTAHLSSEVERGSFHSAETQLKSIVTSSD